MAYFPDLSPYSYGHSDHPGVVHIGWLDGVHPFPTGKVESSLIEKMKSLATKPVELYRGKHTCELCTGAPDVFVRGTLNPVWVTWAAQRSSNSEIRVIGESIIFAAPVLIIHYIEAHEYLPPTQFLQAVAKTK
jgi:hypothetical protein